MTVNGPLVELIGAFLLIVPCIICIIVGLKVDNISKKILAVVAFLLFFTWLALTAKTLDVWAHTLGGFPK